MSDRSKQTWLDFIETYKEMRLLWDPKHEHRFNKELRGEAFDNLFEIYRRIDESATLDDMKNRIGNMRTSFKREMKKVQESLENGIKYKPTLWYFDMFSSFLEPDSESARQYNTIKHFKNNMIVRPSRSERLSLRASQSSRGTNGSIKNEDDDDDTETTEPPQKKRRIYHLLQKQEQFVDRANRLLGQREEDWEVHGKAIALQLHQLSNTQRTIAQKLISDTIFFGNLQKLTEESCITLDKGYTSPVIHEQIDYLEEGLATDDDE